MEVFRPELQIFPLRAFIDEARDAFGSERLEALLKPYGVPSEAFSDPSAWVSLEFVESLLARMQDEAGDEGFFDRATLRGMSPKYIGPLYPLMVALGSPAFTYNQLGRAAGRFNKTGRWTAKPLGPGEFELSWTPKPGLRETTPYICRTRVLQLAKIPTLFTRPPATVAHPRCVLRGDECCTYEVKWSEPRTRQRARIAAALGVLLGATLAAVVAAPVWFAIVVAVGLGLGGWALGRVSLLRTELSSRLTELAEHNQALDRVARANEQRYAELLEAKREVDQKVEDRTHDLREASARLSESLSQIRELDRAKTEFFSNVSHELRTPLTLILGPLEDLVAGREPRGGMRKGAEIMHRNATRLLQLINQLLDLAKVDAGKMRIARVPTEPAALLSNVEVRFGAAAASRNITVTTNVPAPLSPAPLDTAWMESALTNLVANAMRYARTRVELRVFEEQGDLVFEVEDDGPGIGAEDQARVFDRFAQGQDASGRKGGTGLGLAIVRETARLHGGEATVRSTQGQGTTFTIRVPRVSAVSGETTPTPTPEPAASASAGTPTPAVSVDPVDINARSATAAVTRSGKAEQTSWPGPAAGAPLLLVVEDDDDLRWFTADVLSSDYRVEVARDGQEALQRIPTLRPDAIVSDVSMPLMDGLELCRRLRADDETRSLPIILLTARRDVSRLLEGFEAGADDYLTKPFHARELLARVGVHVRFRQLVRDVAHRERLASLGVLAASIAHQVRNPLAALLSGLPSLRRKMNDRLDERSREIIDVMIDSAERVERLTRDLLDLSRVDRESLSRFRPGDGVRASLRLITTRLPGSVAIESDIIDDIEIEGRAGDMNHVFMNLIDNAVRAVESGGTVRVRTRRDSGQFVFEVGDSGPGVPPDKREWIFTPFATTRRAGEGTGLGLAIVRQVILQHGGTIVVDQSELGGALFVVRVPEAHAETQPSPERMLPVLTGQ